jgi:VIT1/CCC1 family predicted Fe2+/Mn2+ transporter
MFDELEFNPMGLGLGILGGIVSLYVMKNVEVGIIYKIGAFCGTVILSYIISSKILGE